MNVDTAAAIRGLAPNVHEWRAWFATLADILALPEVTA